MFNLWRAVDNPEETMPERKSDTSLIGAWDFPVALALLTRLPLPRIPQAAFARQARAAWAFPLVGCFVGAIAAVVGISAIALGLPATVVAGLCLATQIIVTGAMHEDGLADSADGLWGGWTLERRLEIMKDSQIGTYGVLALILSLGLRWSALSLVVIVTPWLLIPIAALSRAGLPVMMALVPRARPGGLSDQVGNPGWRSAGIAILVGVGVSLIGFGFGTALLCAAVLLTLLLAIAALAKAKIGGQTGDILGASQQVGEIALLLILAAQLSSSA